MSIEEFYAHPRKVPLRLSVLHRNFAHGAPSEAFKPFERAHSLLQLHLRLSEGQFEGFEIQSSD